MGATRKKIVLCVTYDENLLRTRQWLLESAGYQVIPAHDYREAAEQIKKSNYDLLLLGHTVTPADKPPLAGMSRAPVLSVYRHDAQPLTNADFRVNANDGPGALLAAVEKALATRS